ncbi:hypothetical protein [Consotaella salsifontis]|uniref:Uncharacterized protein n=1 Tax=Consotaella salsifontis TaxID=1365950 RepID=A0A1T4SS35_9HYPH|nr:hypothetical protein [Consotaella salsifontis]SKA31120.1 hypothetical protein SAMN05428963_113120 [Consotaella salsifontis]
MMDLTGSDIQAFQEAHGLSDLALARAIGWPDSGRSKVWRWKLPEGHKDRLVPPPEIGLALAALAAGLEPWRSK